MASKPETNVCLFAGSRSGTSATFAQTARDVVDVLAKRGYGLVYGAGNVGLMNELAEAAIARGVYVVGVIPKNLVAREAAHQGLSELHIVADMLERKSLMAERSDAFVAIPGGVGTFDEIFEMLTWEQLGIHAKGCGVVNVENYFSPLVGLLENAVKHGFLGAEQAQLLRVDDNAERLIDRLLPGASS
jgi:uncharacterized protein (TIGR00730 family)